FHQDLELVPVVLQEREFEIVGNAVHAPRLGVRLETAHHQAADLLLEIDVPIGIAHDRQVGMHAFDLAGDDVTVLGRMHRDSDAAHFADLARPLARAVDDDFGLYRPSVRLDAGYDAVFGIDSGDPHLFKDFRAAIARALGQRLGQVGRVGLAVAGQPDRTDEIADRHHRPAVERLARRNHLDVDALRARRR